MALVPLILGEPEQEEGMEGGKAGLVVVEGRLIRRGRERTREKRMRGGHMF